MESDAYLYELQDKIERQQKQDVQSDEEGSLVVDFPIQEVSFETPLVEGIGVVIPTLEQFKPGQRVAVRATGMMGVVKRANLGQGLVEVVPRGSDQSLLFSSQELRAITAQEIRQVRIAGRKKNVQSSLATDLHEKVWTWTRSDHQKINKFVDSLSNTEKEKMLSLTPKELRERFENFLKTAKVLSSHLTKKAYLLADDENREILSEVSFENDCLTATNRRYHHSISEAIDDFSGRLNLTASVSPQTRSEMKKIASMIREEETVQEKTDSVSSLEEDFLRAFES